MPYDDLVKRLRDISNSDSNIKSNYIGLTMLQAADATEELANKLCDWCGVCPKEKRRPWECEIMWPDAPVPEVWIEPPKDE